MPDGSDLKKKTPFGSLMGKKKKPDSEPEPEKKKSWWTL
jgi:hypothetical protein